MCAWGVPQDTEDAALLVTELVANVIDHVGCEAGLTLELAVSDGWLSEDHAGGKRVWFELAPPGR
jgi:hypothetical protein